MEGRIQDVHEEDAANSLLHLTNVSLERPRSLQVEKEKREKGSPICDTKFQPLSANSCQTNSPAHYSQRKGKQCWIGISLSHIPQVCIMCILNSCFYQPLNPFRKSNNSRQRVILCLQRVKNKVNLPHDLLSGLSFVFQFCRGKWIWICHLGSSGSITTAMDLVFPPSYHFCRRYSLICQAKSLKSTLPISAAAALSPPLKKRSSKCKKGIKTLAFRSFLPLSLVSSLLSS